MSDQKELAPEISAPSTRVKVVDQDIFDAVAGDQYKCAIVRAVQRQVPGAVRVRVNKHTIAWSVDEQRFVYPTPQVAIDAIIIPLDTGGKPEPLTLKLDGGFVKPVIHNEGDTLDKKRKNDRDYAANHPNRHLHTYGRYGDH